MKRAYVPPQDVTAPKRRWTLVDVLYDEGEGRPSLAMGRWEKKPVLAMRWNGDRDSPIGNPQSRGLATWFVLPRYFYAGILKSLKSLPRPQKAMALRFLGERAR